MNKFTYVVMICLILVCLGQLTGCAVNVVTMPNATILIDSGFEQGTVKKGL